MILNLPQFKLTSFEFWCVFFLLNTLLLWQPVKTGGFVIPVYVEMWCSCAPLSPILNACGESV